MVLFQELSGSQFTAKERADNTQPTSHVTATATSGSSPHTHHVLPSRAEPRGPEGPAVPSSGGSGVSGSGSGVSGGGGGSGVSVGRSGVSGDGSCGSGGGGSCGSGGPSPRPGSSNSCRSDSFITLEEFAALTQRLHEAESQLQVKPTSKTHLHWPKANVKARAKIPFDHCRQSILIAHLKRDNTFNSAIHKAGRTVPSFAWYNS